MLPKAIGLPKLFGLLFGVFISTLLIKKQTLYNLKIITLLEFKKLQSQRDYLIRQVSENRAKLKSLKSSREKMLLAAAQQRDKGSLQGLLGDSLTGAKMLTREAAADIEKLTKYKYSSLPSESELESISVDNKKAENLVNAISVPTDYHTFNSIYIGVLTCKPYLSTRAQSINATWGNIEYLTSDYSHRKIEYFAKIPNEELSDYQKMNVNNLMHVDPNLDDKVYPPQQKAFGMLQHICEREIDQYKWYLRADDDVYVDVNGLEKLLDRIDSNRITYLGQPGMGWVEHRDKLGLAGHNFCMGGPGVLFSNALMRKICPFIDRCRKEVASLEEDVELGRCVTKYADVECAHSWEGIKRFHHAYDGTYKGVAPYSDNDLDENHDIKDSMTLHHVKVPWIMYKVHRYFLKRQMVALDSKHSYDKKMDVDSFLAIYQSRLAGEGGICPNFNKMLKFERSSYFSKDYKVLPLIGPLLEELIHVSEDVFDELMKAIVSNEIKYLKKQTNLNNITPANAKKNLYVNSISGFVLEKSFKSDVVGYVFDIEFRRLNDNVSFNKRVFISRSNKNGK